MGTFNFDFSFPRSGAPIITLSGIGLAFNAGARAMLGYPDEVDIGFDDEQNVIGIRAHLADSDAPSYQFESRMKDGWVRISMKDFVKYLSQKSGIDFVSKAQQFLPEKDPATGMLLVYVDKDHLKNK